MGIATVITSGKGGVGKSTAAVGLGRALAQRGRRVLLVDCDAGLFPCRGHLPGQRGPVPVARPRLRG